MGNFAESFGDDFFGLKELGIADEFGLSSLTVPKRLLKGKGKGSLKEGPSVYVPHEYLILRSLTRYRLAQNQRNLRHLSLRPLRSYLWIRTPSTIRLVCSKPFIIHVSPRYKPLSLLLLYPLVYRHPSLVPVYLSHKQAPLCYPPNIRLLHLYHPCPLTRHPLMLILYLPLFRRGHPIYPPSSLSQMTRRQRRARRSGRSARSTRRHQRRARRRRRAKRSLPPLLHPRPDLRQQTATCLSPLRLFRPHPHRLWQRVVWRERKGRGGKAVEGRRARRRPRLRCCHRWSWRARRPVACAVGSSVGVVVAVKDSADVICLCIIIGRIFATWNSCVGDGYLRIPCRTWTNRQVRLGSNRIGLLIQDVDVTVVFRHLRRE